MTRRKFVPVQIITPEILTALYICNATLQPKFLGEVNAHVLTISINTQISFTKTGCGVVTSEWFNDRNGAFDPFTTASEEQHKLPWMFPTLQRGTSKVHMLFIHSTESLHARLLADILARRSERQIPWQRRLLVHNELERCVTDFKSWLRLGIELRVLIGLETVRMHNRSSSDTAWNPLGLVRDQDAASWLLACGSICQGAMWHVCSGGINC